MAVGYRAVLRIDEDISAVKVAREQLYSWLTLKRKDRRSTVATTDWEGAGRHLLGERAVLEVVHEAPEREGVQRRLYRLTETNELGTWPVTLYAMEDRSGTGGVIVIEAGLEGVDETDAMARVSPPRIVRGILDAVRVRDGSTALHGTPGTVQDAEAVIDAITDPQRSAAVIVAASPGPEIEDRWRDVVRSLTRESAGVASAFVVGWSAVAALNERLPHAYRVEPGRVRTYLPGVDLENPAGAKRHPVLGPITLTRSLRGSKVAEYLARAHAAAVRRRLLEFELPHGVRRGIDLLRRAEARMWRDLEVRERVSGEPEPPAPASDELDGLGLAGQAVGRLLKRWLKTEDWTLADLDRLDELLLTRTIEGLVAAEDLERAERDVHRLEGELRDANRRRDDLEADLADIDEQAQKHEREAVELRRRLLKAGLYEEAYIAPEAADWSAPGSVEELVNRLTAGEDAHPVLRRVEFTGDRARALEIDRRDNLGRCASRLWEYIHALHDYAERRVEGYSGNVDTYLNNDNVDGYRCSAERHASNESESVLDRPKWRGERILPVPEKVDRSGKVLMAAHFKVSYLGQFAPRMHYYDDTARTRKIYIGYIGRHLTNTKT